MAPRTSIIASASLTDLVPLYRKEGDIHPAGYIKVSDLSEQIDIDTAADVVNVPSGNIEAEDLQAAVNELDGQDTAVALAASNANALKADIAGQAFTGPVITDPSDADDAGLNLPAGVAPTVPVAGDIWFDGTEFHLRDGDRVITIGGGHTRTGYAIADVGNAGTHDLGGFIRTPAADTTLTMGVTETQTYGDIGSMVGAHAFIVVEGPGSFSYDITVVGTHGTLVIDIDGTDYSQVFNTNSDTTATDWIATHTAALGGLGTPIVPVTG